MFLLVLAHPGSPGQRVVKGRVCVSFKIMGQPAEPCSDWLCRLGVLDSDWTLHFVDGGCDWLCRLGVLDSDWTVCFVDGGSDWLCRLGVPDSERQVQDVTVVVSVRGQ